MKTANMHIAVVEFTCPNCDEHISSADGSHMFELHQIPDTIGCDCCGVVLKIPEKARKLKKEGL